MSLESLRAALTRPFRIASFTGPIFAKELRVSSRRRRNYVLRFAYVAALAAVVVIVWQSEIPSLDYARMYGTSSWQFVVSRMAEIGRVITGNVIWFQFIAVQLVAMVSLSTAISDEILHRTLGVLLTTPITSVQIVTGKLASRLWQVIILVLISVPVLAVVRVFGGVPLGYIIAGVSITLASALLLGSISLYFSIFHRHASAAIMRTLFVAALFVFAPVLMLMMLKAYNDTTMYVVCAYLNPLMALGTTTEDLLTGGLGATWSPFRWEIHCAIMCLAAAVVLAFSVRAVRRAALEQAVGAPAEPHTGMFRRMFRRLAQRNERNASSHQVDILDAGDIGNRRADGCGTGILSVSSRVPHTGGTGILPVSSQAPSSPHAAAPRGPRPDRPIRPVVGPPVLWKEIRTPLLRDRRHRVLAARVLVLTYALVYAFWAANGDLARGGIHAGYATMMLVIALFCTALFSATTITSEKESGCWPLLLGTTLTNRQILLGKALGVFRRCAVIWGLLFAHVLLFVFVGYIHPVVLFHLPIVAAGSAVFVAALGLYFSSRCRRSVAAVLLTLVLAPALWTMLLAVPDILLFVLQYILRAAPVRVPAFAVTLAVSVSAIVIYFRYSHLHRTAIVLSVSAAVFLFWLVMALFGAQHGHPFRPNQFGLQLDGPPAALHPIVQSFVVTETASGSRNASSPLSRLDYLWPRDEFDWSLYRARGNNTFGHATYIVVGAALAESAIAAALFWLAARRLRRRAY